MVATGYHGNVACCRPVALQCRFTTSSGTCLYSSAQSATSSPSGVPSSGRSLPTPAVLSHWRGMVREAVCFRSQRPGHRVPPGVQVRPPVQSAELVRNVRVWCPKLVVADARVAVTAEVHEQQSPLPADVAVSDRALRSVHADVTRLPGSANLRSFTGPAAASEPKSAISA